MTTPTYVHCSVQKQASAQGFNKTTSHENAHGVKQPQEGDAVRTRIYHGHGLAALQGRNPAGKEGAHRGKCYALPEGVG